MGGILDCAPGSRTECPCLGQHRVDDVKRGVDMVMTIGGLKQSLHGVKHSVVYGQRLINVIAS